MFQWVHDTDYIKIVTTPKTKSVFENPGPKRPGFLFTAITLILTWLTCDFDRCKNYTSGFGTEFEFQ